MTAKKRCNQRSNRAAVFAMLNDQDGKPLGDLVQIYEPLLPFPLDPSFLQHDIVGDDFKGLSVRFQNCE